MAPPRTTKASSHSNLANATRQGTRKSNKQNDEDDEEMEESDNIDSMDVDDEESTEPPTTSAQELIANMVEGVSASHQMNPPPLFSPSPCSARRNVTPC
jgi:ribosomal protein L6P/L9E